MVTGRGVSRKNTPAEQEQKPIHARQMETDQQAPAPLDKQSQEAEIVESEIEKLKSNNCGTTFCSAGILPARCRRYNMNIRVRESLFCSPTFQHFEPFWKRPELSNLPPNSPLATLRCTYSARRLAFCLALG